MVEWPGMVLDAGFREYPSEPLVLGLNGIPSEPAVRWRVRPRVQSREGGPWKERVGKAIRRWSGLIPVVSALIQLIPQILLIVKQLTGH